MELVHKINGVVIDEPIGFDNLKTKIQRGEYHGMSAEVSLGDLEFHDNAMDIISAAYHSDIDTELQYVVSHGETVVYSGIIDLSTYREQRSKYRSVLCKVGEVGVKTMFNNRASTEIDLNSDKTIDGTALLDAPEWESLPIPARHLKYTGRLVQNKDEILEYSTEEAQEYFGKNMYMLFSPNKESANELETLTSNIRVLSGLDDFDYGAFFIRGDIDEKVGTGNKWDVMLNIQMNVSVSLSMEAGDVYICSAVPVLIVDGHEYWRYYEYRTSIIAEQSERKTWGFDVNIPQFSLKGITGTSFKFGLRVNTQYIAASSWRGVSVPQINLKTGSFFKISTVDTLDLGFVSANFMFVNDALNTIIESISENGLKLQSDWYYPGTPGGGAMKAITNGYKMRGLFTNSEKERNMPLSFKSAIESLSAMDCIGWAIIGDRVRVEPWGWFYKDDVVLTIQDPDKIEREINPDAVITELNIGYKKYATQDEYNSIDSIHGERTFVSKMKAISNSKSVLCDFIADNYAIEETRRARSQVDESEEFKYDENIFVFELCGSSRLSYFYIPQGQITNVSGIEREGEALNARISPWYNAGRWRDYLFSAFFRGDMSFQSGTINYAAKYDVTSNVGEHTLSVPAGYHGEDDAIAYNHAKFTAEIVTINYPISAEQYLSIKSNPYGVVVVKGEPMWIKEFTYSFKDGVAEFKLIPKYTE